MSQQVRDYLDLHKARIDEEIAGEIARRLEEVGKISTHLTKAVQAIEELSVGGKRLRGLLTILGYEIAGGEVNQEIYKAAAAMELFHLGLLIQDDVMDRDDLRRGVKTVHARYEDKHLGESVAICAGDLTFGWVTEILAGLLISKEGVTAAIKVWGKYFGRVGYGQILDVLGEQRGDGGEQEVLQVLQLKSGEYTCVLPILLGAALAGGKRTLQERLKSYGMELGWVFQLRDDYLSEYGDSSKTGKPVGNDRREGRRSYTTMYGKEATEQAIAEHLAKGKELAEGNEILIGLLDWMATREN